MKLLSLITENHKHEYGCVMLHFNFPEMEKIQDMINPNDIYEDETDDSYGLETEAHVTLLYGLHKEVSSENVKEVLKNFSFGQCKLNNASLFENEKYDVLKYDIDGDGLHKANLELKKFPYTSDFPEYHPHLTIAYLKPKTGKKYSDALKNSSFTLIPTYAIYSQTDGTKQKIKIKK